MPPTALVLYYKSQDAEKVRRPQKSPPQKPPPQKPPPQKTLHKNRLHKNRLQALFLARFAFSKQGHGWVRHLGSCSTCPLAAWGNGEKK
jgi:hypothetical protein